MKKALSLTLLLALLLNCFFETTVLAADTLNEDFCPKTSDGTHIASGFLGASKVDDCTQPRYYTTTCKACKEIFWAELDSTNSINPTYHHMIPSKLESADCELGVVEHSYCKNCKFELHENIGVMEHSWSKTYITDDCNAGVVIHSKCTVCNKENNENLGAQEHSLSIIDAEDNVYPTCTQDGKLHYKCDICGYEVFQTVPASHTWAEWVIDKSPTCTTDGTKHRLCQECGVSRTDTIAPKGHLFFLPEDFESNYQCHRCGILRKDCTHLYKEEYHRDATCNANGYDCIRCRDCHSILKTIKTYISLGHNFVQNDCSRCNTQEFEYGVNGNTAYTTKYNGDKTEIQVPASIAGHRIVTIGYSTFEDCKFIKSVTISDGIESVGDGAFFRCTNLTSLFVPVSITYIANNALAGCNNLKYIHYAGTKKQWSEVEKAFMVYSGEISEFDQRVIVCSDSTIIPTPKVTSTNTIGGITLNWHAVTDAAKYNVYRRKAGESSYTYLGTTTGTSFFDKNVKSGQYYCYTVRAFNADGSYSAYESGKTSTRRYMAIPKLTTIYNHQNGLAIKWNAVAGVTNGYRVYRRGAGQTTWTYLGTTKNLYFIDSAVKNRNGEYYRYTVIADGGYHSKFDTTGLYLRRLANPTLNSAVSSKSGITVKWGKVAGSSGYYVYRKTANSTWTRVGVVSGVNNLSYLDKTAKKGTTYTYTVRAVYGNTLSSYYSGISCKHKY